ncbi:hypothetical protein SAMN05216168_1466 [Kosakonia radicincitans]|nr:hypothetical protein SAMN05216168_1466 [Kosakonia radicincitans]
MKSQPMTKCITEFCITLIVVLINQESVITGNSEKNQ